MHCYPKQWLELVALCSCSLQANSRRLKSRPEVKIVAIWVHETQMSFQRRWSYSIDHTNKIWGCILLPA